MTRLARAQLTLALIGGALAGGVAIVHAINGDPLVAVWAALAAVWAFIVAIHRCPAPAPSPAVERGMQCVHFTGGPEDGGAYVVPFADRDLLAADLCLEGADYRVTEVEKTCFHAELAPAEEVDS